MSDLTRKQVRHLDKYLRQIKDQLGCRDWNIYAARDTLPEPGSFAQIMFWTGLKQAEVQVRNDFFTHSPEAQREALIHEVLHCHIGGPIKDTGWDLSGVLEEPALTMFNRYHNERLETATDAIASAIAGLFALPDFGKAKP